MQTSLAFSLFTIYVLWNVAAFFLVMLDKQRARRRDRRIRERTFFLWAFVFGAAGVLLGMYIFRHKTRHLSFVIGMPIMLLLHFLLIIYVTGY